MGDERSISPSSSSQDPSLGKICGAIEYNSEQDFRRHVS